MHSWLRTFSFDAPGVARPRVSEHLHERSKLAPPRVLPAVGEVPKPTLEESQAMTRRRAEALRSMFPKLFSWFASRWDVNAVGEVNTYLEQSTNLADLERRIRLLEQRRHFGA